MDQSYNLRISGATIHMVKMYGMNQRELLVQRIKQGMTMANNRTGSQPKRIAPSVEIKEINTINAPNGI